MLEKHLWKNTAERRVFEWQAGEGAGGRKQLGKEGGAEGHKCSHFGSELPRVLLGAFIDQLACSR